MLTGRDVSAAWLGVAALVLAYLGLPVIDLFRAATARLRGA